MQPMAPARQLWIGILGKGVGAQDLSPKVYIRGPRASILYNVLPSGELPLKTTRKPNSMVPESITVLTER